MLIKRRTLVFNQLQRKRRCTRCFDSLWGPKRGEKTLKVCCAIRVTLQPFYSLKLKYQSLLMSFILLAPSWTPHKHNLCVGQRRKPSVRSQRPDNTNLLVGRTARRFLWRSPHWRLHWDTPDKRNRTKQISDQWKEVIYDKQTRLYAEVCWSELSSDITVDAFLATFFCSGNSWYLNRTLKCFAGSGSVAFTLFFIIILFGLL